MNDDALKATVVRLCEAVMKEVDPDRLLQLMIELNHALDALNNPRPSRFREPTYMYNPTLQDIEWAKATIRMLSDEGMLVYPGANLHYLLDKARRVLTLQNTDQLFDRESFVTHVQTIAVFAKIGYTVNEREDA